MSGDRIVESVRKNMCQVDILTNFNIKAAQQKNKPRNTIIKCG